MTDSNEYAEVVARISEATGAQFVPASEKQMAELKELGLPESILAFYRSYAPRRIVDGQVHLWPAWEAPGVNANTPLGAAVSRHGYILFADTYGGDPYAFDLNETDADGQPRIVLFSHEAYYEDCSRDDVNRLAKPVAGSLREFLQQFVEERVDDYPDPDY